MFDDVMVLEGLLKARGESIGKAQLESATARASLIRICIPHLKINQRHYDKVI